MPLTRSSKRKKEEEKDISSISSNTRKQNTAGQEGGGAEVVPKLQKKDSHSLDQVHVRFSTRLRVIEFGRAQAGSSGVPKSGGYSLGIGGDGKCVLTPFENFEKERAPRRRKYPASTDERTLRKLDEAERKKLLLGVFSENELDQSESKTLDEIRTSRKNVCCPRGCRCKDTTCPCRAGGVGCHDDSGQFCGCKAPYSTSCLQ
mmetsp:Transcript_3279/g.5072  ORF Transcript_3279/g.5072 Transcript_3279/m.5072 type:complete len:203 (+) Transcript_3279:78-686(+)